MVHAVATVRLRRSDSETELLLDRPCEKATCAVRLPTRHRHDLRDGGTLWPPQHLDHFRLFTVLAGARYRLGGLRSRDNRITIDFWHHRLRRLPLAPHSSVACVGESIVVIIDGD